ncbi:MAG: putative toxin-antitoxin system toxin component, PIN family [Alphaproteobacteria bacterium RIFCSPLOWO2_01_FULL_40_26]|nr:MAG: putative toxin-antitoxin system toxin component, PIN family [Alphaproteobacteria bacterium RIFCSPHIGHO2_02_FULL_40_34]OFW94765.1 MAG: putative toxin-antitoxin system toxin component, PIN family [Alphaproteobacteria bacterium RIFCSPLOWO2_01_FULL_40_26]OFX10393.1 MAG: putative toxin-antitoxin system toxin component, PIN family [Alphaproteobacteria bacterium RIFCSPLOWO2_02_FULL_40_19]OFX11274.1 MAG: putative toxin-antitoxin system toxin component, PIN family [Alphaproteobacteria bacterium R
MKLVLDTNVFVSGLFLPKSNAGKILNLCMIGRYDLCLSEELICEIERVLFYPKIKKRLNLSESEIENYCALLRFRFNLCKIKNVKAKVPKDSKDNHILATFKASYADYLITGDDDLLSLRNEYQIISLKDFIEKFVKDRL